MGHEKRRRSWWLRQCFSPSALSAFRSRMWMTKKNRRCSIDKFQQINAMCRCFDCRTSLPRMRDGRRRTQTTSSTSDFGLEQIEPQGFAFCLARGAVMKNPDDKIELQIGPMIEVKFLDPGADVGVFDGY